MANALGALFERIATSIRNKSNITGPMKPIDFPDYIDNIVINGDDERVEQLSNIIYGLIAKKERYVSGKDTVLAIPSVITDSGQTLVTLLPYSLVSFTNAVYAKFTTTTWLQDYSLAYNDNLELVEININNDTAIMGCMLTHNCLYGCTKIKSIIIRWNVDDTSELQTAAIGLDMTNGTRTTLNNTNEDHCIYVSDFMYDSVVENNAHYNKSRIRKLSEYPEIDNWESNV